MWLNANVGSEDVVVLLRRAAFEIEKLRKGEGRCLFCGVSLPIHTKVKRKKYCCIDHKNAHYNLMKRTGK